MGIRPGKRTQALKFPTIFKNSILLCVVVTSPRPEMTPTSKESTEQSTEKSTESAEEIDEKSIEEQTTKPVSTTTPNIELLYVKEAEVSRDRNEELENKVEGTIELSKTHKIHILHELSGMFIVFDLRYSHHFLV